MRPLFGATCALLLACGVADGQAIRAAFVTTAGTDTFCLEQYTRNGNVITGSWVVLHPPGVFVHDYTIALGADGTPVRYTMKYSTPGAATQPDLDSVIVQYGGDTAVYTVVTKDSAFTRRSPMRDAFPLLGQSWVGLELGLVRLRRMRVDSGVIVTNSPTQPALAATPLPVTFRGGDSVAIGNIRGAVSPDGSLLGFTQMPLVVRRVASLDMSTLVQGFVAAFAPRAAALAAAAASRVEVTLPAAQLDKLVGEYSLNATNTITITRDREHLVMTLPNGARLALLAQSQTQFFVRKPDLVLVFDAGADGIATAVVLVQGETKQRLAKLAK